MQIKPPPISLGIFNETQNEFCECRSDYRRFWSQQQKMLRTYHEASGSGMGLVQMHSQLMDVLIRCCFHSAEKIYLSKYGTDWPSPISLVALGGYGRGELSPCSDVDLMLLYSKRVSSQSLLHLSEIIDTEIIHPLWDLKIVAKCVYRTIEYSITDARNNFRIKNAQFDARLICGSKDLFGVYQEEYQKYFTSESVESFENQCIEDKNLRHKKCNFIVFLQEPDVKTGVGGLYDYHTIFWLARASLKVSTMEAIEHQGGVSKKERVQLEKAYDFILRVRNELHFQNGSGNNILNRDQQSRIAWALGYKEDWVFTRVRAFMSDYYGHTQKIHEVLQQFEERLKQLREQKKRQSLFKMIFKNRFKGEQNRYAKKYISGFIIINDFLTYASKNIFIEDPINLIRAFRYSQQYRVKMSPEIKVLIKESAHLITEDVINDQSSNRCFSSILQAVGEVYPTLALMHGLGVLGHFLPEFKEITHLVQHGQYHQYTADIHTLNAIQVLDEIFKYKNSKEKRYYESIKSLISPWLLYVLILLYDLGKEHMDHQEKRIAVAKPILDRLEVEPKQQEHILFVIKNDKKMIQFWEHCDLVDSENSNAFALFVGNIELLNYFYVHTYCDLASTAVGLWSGHKEILHTKLFEQTRQFLMEHKKHITKDGDDSRSRYRELIYKRNPDFTQNQADAMLEIYSDVYFEQNSPQEFDLHLQLFTQVSQHIEHSNCSGALMPAIHWEYDIDRCLTIVTIITWDRTGLFASLSGALSLSDFNILTAKSFSRSDQMSLNIFQIIESNSNNETNENLEEKFRKNLREILINDMDPTSMIAKQIKKRRKKENTTSVVQAIKRVYMNYEPLEKKTEIEIHCTNRSDLIHQFTKAITEHGFNIVFSRIFTENSEIVSKFHIQKNNVYEITTTKNLIALRECLDGIIETKK